ncbi:hypothetical protein P43SY_009732 [Pythium insidiosum]|uniref:Protein kinase domain-containing protein n=1 Tax=Pythium insidiosum TaxID=114742 RepID=A0AAD5LJ57_PYTIN|nr:hypothetical protein P43SY_009732 [Pythium insidiosum]
MTNCSVSTVVVPRNVFAMLPSYNPFVGTFHHAPSAGNRGAAFFSGDIIGMAELEERKKFRHHPLTGIFHSLPGYYDPLHRLSQFRQDGEDGDHLSVCDTDSVRSFVAVDLADTEDMETGLAIGQPKSLSPVTEQYELVGADQLGDGSYAVVKPAIRRANGKEVAIKQIHKRYLTTEESKSAVEREIEIHLRLKHRNIVRLHEVYETDDFLYLVMSKAKKGNLKQLMQRKRRLSEALAAKLAQQIVRAVFFLHDSGVLHCDLKPENILLTDARVTNQDTNDSNSPVNRRRGSLVNSLDPHADVKVCDLQVELCDFGLSVKVPDVRFYKLTGDVHKVPFTGVTGTPGYIAPELLQQQPYGKPVDMWSVGIVIYEMLTGYQPFYPPHACIHEKADFNDRVWKSISVQAKDLVMRLLESDPSKRLTAANALSHGWFDTATFAI